jgi:hypothetical protein
MSLFIGGLHDGEWHRVERLPDNALPKSWSMAKRLPAKYSPDYFARSPVELVSRSDHYTRLEFHVDGCKYHVFGHYKLKAHEVFEMLLRGYQHMEIEE